MKARPHAKRTSHSRYHSVLEVMQVQLGTKKLMPEASTAPSTAASADSGNAADLTATAQPTASDADSLKNLVIAKLRTCYDPEIPVNIWELGLIYSIDVGQDGSVHIKMTLTSPACPVAGSLPPEVQDKVAKIPGVSSAKVEVVWDPPWSMDRMSEAAKLQLGFY